MRFFNPVDKQSMTGNKEVEDLIEEKAADFYMSMSAGSPKQQGKVHVR